MDDNSYKKYRIILKSGYALDVFARVVSVREYDVGKKVLVQFQNPEHNINVEHLDGDEVAAVVRILT